MPSFRVGQPAVVAHAALRETLSEWQRVEKQAVLWFADIMKRRLFRELGFASMYAYASEALGFSASKTSQFIRLAKSLEQLPALHRSVARGEITWTKARELSKVATRKTEQRWLDKAAESSSRELEAEVRQAREEARHRSSHDLQPSLLPRESSCTPEAESVQVTTLRFRPEEKARFEALVEKLHKRSRGRDAHRWEALVLAGLESLLADENSSDAIATSSAEKFTRVKSSPYQIVIHRDEEKQGATVSVGRKAVSLSEASYQRIACDARILEPGRRNRASIPPAVRRAVLARDRHRCQAPGCGATRFLEVHHLQPRRAGGSNRPENLTTLCSACHQLLHERGLAGKRAFAPVSAR